MNKKQIIILTTIVTVIFLSVYYLFTNRSVIKTPKTILVAPVVYKDVKVAKTSFANFGVALSNNSKINTNGLNVTNTILPETVNIYSYKDLTQTEWQQLTQSLSKSLGLQIENGAGTLNKKMIYIDYNSGIISYTNDSGSTNTFSEDFNDQVFLPQAKQALIQMGFNLSNYVYTTYSYEQFDKYYYNTVNTPTEAITIKYTFEQNIDGYQTIETVNNSTKKLSIWIDSSGKVVKFQGSPFGHVEEINATVATKPLEEIKKDILAGNIIGIGGSVTITGHELTSINITKSEIIYSIIGENAIPLVKLTCDVETARGTKGVAYFVTDLIDLNNVKEINK